ncbi:MAG: hypothetical protein H6828_01065 [Planctomycetes bacterium]|nr:hypothetical protein [Planctomycetota bacterium]
MTSDPLSRETPLAALADEPRAPLPTEVSSPAPRDERRPRLALTLLSFGFKYGQPPANHYFDVSFLKNPAREDGWDLFSQRSDGMRRWVLEQRDAVEFLERMVPLACFLARADDDARIALGCSAGRHRSAILVEELARRLRAEGLDVHVHHREGSLS